MLCSLLLVRLVFLVLSVGCRGGSFIIVIIIAILILSVMRIFWRTVVLLGVIRVGLRFVLVLVLTVRRLVILLSLWNRVGLIVLIRRRWRRRLWVRLRLVVLLSVMSLGLALVACNRRLGVLLL